MAVLGFFFGSNRYCQHRGQEIEDLVFHYQNLLLKSSLSLEVEKRSKHVQKHYEQRHDSAGIASRNKVRGRHVREPRSL